MTRPTPSHVAALVAQAARELARTEYPASNGPYAALVDWSHGNRLARVELAAAIYLEGCAQLRGSRALDNCFEAGDGSDVVADLVGRADRDPALFAAIAADFGGTFPASWRARAAERPGQLAFAL